MKSSACLDILIWFERERSLDTAVDCCWKLCFLFWGTTDEFVVDGFRDDGFVDVVVVVALSESWWWPS